ncbi:MAG: hypothetical protein AB7I33_07585 [Gemmatimonadales bacterium]
MPGIRSRGHGADGIKIIATVTTLAAAVLATGCSAPAPAGAPGQPAPAGGGSRPLSRLYLLEAWGAPPGDTTAMLAPGLARTIVLRHAPPDNTVFAELHLPAGAFAPAAAAADSVGITLVPRPGVYGLDITTTQPLAAPAVLVFKYPIHFSAPADATRRYGNTAAFERALVIAREESPGVFRLLPSTRPATDNLQATISGAGSYLVVAPR